MGGGDCGVQMKSRESTNLLSVKSGSIDLAGGVKGRGAPQGAVQLLFIFFVSKKSFGLQKKVDS